MVLRYCPSSQFGSYQGGFQIVRPTTTGVAISVVPLMFRLGTAKYVHAVIVGGDRTGAVPWRSGSAASPRAAPARAGTLTGSGPCVLIPLDLRLTVPGSCVLPASVRVGSQQSGATTRETLAWTRPTSRCGCSAR